MHLVIPIFIPHQGCPHRCLFCNQISITGIGSDREYELPQIASTIEQWLSRSRRQQTTHVAFYGGSFTCLPWDRQERMLAVVQPFIEEGKVDGIRLSTRPDCVDPTICKNLRQNRVVMVELGVQSLDNAVLVKSQRGHTANDCRQAVSHLKKAGLAVGIQLMPGLPGESSRSFFRTVRETIALGPSLVRLYPALVVANSGLAEMYAAGEYVPLSLNRAIALTCKAKKMFDTAGIKVIRMGLQPSESLEKELLAGPYHPAFGELVNARAWFKRVRRLMSGYPMEKNVEIHISDRDLSAFVGPRKVNLRRLEHLGLFQKMTIVTEKDMERGTLKDVVC